MTEHVTYTPIDLAIIAILTITTIAFGLIGVALLTNKQSNRCQICGAMTDHHRAVRCKGACAKVPS